MTEIMIIGTGLMMTAVAVAVGGVALEAVLRVLCRALQPTALGRSFQPVSEGGAIRFSYAEGRVEAANWAREEPVTASGALPVDTATPNKMRAREYSRARGSSAMNSSSARSANGQYRTGRVQPSLRITSRHARPWSASAFMNPDPTTIVRTKIR